MPQGGWGMRPSPETTWATWVPGSAVAMMGRPLESMPVSLEGMTRSAAPARWGRRWMSAALRRSLRRLMG